jgi:Outer membrane protein beta-barrel domain
MKKLLLLLVITAGAALLCPAQLRVGFKAGLNFANVTNASAINNTNRTGFMAGGFISPRIGAIGYRSELIFSRQGYNFKTNTNTGNVNLDYILLPQLLTLNLGKLITLQAGGQVAFLLNAGVDSSGTGGGTGTPYADLIKYFNRVDFGAAFGAELNPYKGLMLGVRYNISLGNALSGFTASPTPNFIPNVDLKNNVVQVYAGWKLGGKR